MSRPDDHKEDNIGDDQKAKDENEGTEELVEEDLDFEKQEAELVRKALERNNGKRKYAARDLGVSERTLYRKIKEYNIK